MLFQKYSKLKFYSKINKLKMKNLLFEWTVTKFFINFVLQESFFNQYNMEHGLANTASDL